MQILNYFAADTASQPTSFLPLIWLVVVAVAAAAFCLEGSSHSLAMHLWIGTGCRGTSLYSVSLLSQGRPSVGRRLRRNGTVTGSSCNLWGGKKEEKLHLLQTKRASPIPYYYLQVPVDKMGLTHWSARWFRIGVVGRLHCQYEAEDQFDNLLVVWEETAAAAWMKATLNYAMHLTTLT